MEKEKGENLKKMLTKKSKFFPTGDLMKMAFFVKMEYIIFFALIGHFFKSKQKITNFDLFEKSFAKFFS